MIESDIVRWTYYFILSRLWNFACNLLWSLLRNFIQQVISKRTSQKSTVVLANSRFADFRSVDIQEVWAYSIPIIQWIVKENIEYHPFMEGNIRAFITYRELPNDCYIEAILPLVLEHLIEVVHPTIESGISNPPVVKLIVPTIFADPNMGIPTSWFKKVCKHALSQYIIGEFEVTLELQQTHSMRRELQERQHLLPPRKKNN